MFLAEALRRRLIQRPYHHPQWTEPYVRVKQVLMRAQLAPPPAGPGIPGAPASTAPAPVASVPAWRGPGSDEQLLSAGIQGQTSAFDTLFQRHLPWLAGFAWAHLEHHEAMVGTLCEGLSDLALSALGYVPQVTVPLVTGEPVQARLLKWVWPCVMKARLQFDGLQHGAHLPAGLPPEVKAQMLPPVAPEIIETCTARVEEARARLAQALKAHEDAFLEALAERPIVEQELVLRALYKEQATYMAVEMDFRLEPMSEMLAEVAKVLG